MKNYLKKHITGIEKIIKIKGEASLREFFRFNKYKSVSKIAMVYPSKNKKEIDNIIGLTEIYKDYDLLVPDIEEIIENRIIILQDAGKTYFQKEFNNSNISRKKELLSKIAEIIIKINKIPIEKTSQILDADRMKAEMDFFLKYFVLSNLDENNKQNLREKLFGIIERISDIQVFSHRDFHSRNLLVSEGNICIIDFQDSLRGPRYYDIASFLFDSYLTIGNLRKYFFDALKDGNIEIEVEQLNLTALQRNIKALGTFGYQINIRKNLSYKRYISRTIEHIRNNPVYNTIEKSIGNILL